MDPQVAEFLRQKTLYNMQKDLWKLYEFHYLSFRESTLMNAKAPIPPSCKILPLHVQLTVTGQKLENIKTINEILTSEFAESYKEAKRRL
jgi:hypothetical protein